MIICELAAMRVQISVDRAAIGIVRFLVWISFNDVRSSRADWQVSDVRDQVINNRK